jgi:hypothetical protein
VPLCYFALTLSDVTERVRRLTGEIRVLQEQLDRAARQGSGERSKMVDELVDGDLMNDLKNVVDNMRHFLWSYIEATTQNPDDLKSAMQGYRMQRVTEMLRILRESDVPELTKTKYAHSFFEEINNIAHATVDRYNADDDPRMGGAAAGKK